ncbi:XdhC family protein, partial [Acidobacteria bacterium AH-259-A15]|nr:XdhC family protein [Acidobacteria bacterium AH-259-A15]
MREILDDLEHWRADSKKVAMATVVKVYGSAPRPLGSKLALSSAGEMVGSVSGGCVEGAVIEEAREVMQTGQPKLVKFGITDEQAWAVGLSCGGEIEVFVEVLSDLYQELERCLRDEQLVAISTVIVGQGLGSKMLIWPDGQTQGDLRSSDLNRRLHERAGELLKLQKSERVTFDLDGQKSEVFIEVFPPPPKLIIIGAVHVAIPLITFAKVLGFRTIVVDPRSAFATPERFSQADELMVKWPHEALTDSYFNESTYFVVLSHDEKLDNPALKLALESPCRYIGALGSRKTHARRVASLKEMGITGEQLALIHAPIGLDLGARRPEEIALAIIAQIVAVRSGAEP